MKLDDERIFGLVNQTWKSVLGAELSRVESGRPWIGGEPCVTASLRIAGAWGGSAQVRRPSAIALRVAAEVLAMEPKALGTCAPPGDTPGWLHGNNRLEHITGVSPGSFHTFSAVGRFAMRWGRTRT